VIAPQGRSTEIELLFDGPNAGAADSLDEVKAAFRAAGERLLSSEKADEKCST